MATTHTLSCGDRFPDGTTVSVYAAPMMPSGPPSGTPVASGVMTTGQAPGWPWPETSVTFTGLQHGSPYHAYALVDGEHRYVSFVTLLKVPNAAEIERKRSLAQAALVQAAPSELVSPAPGEYRPYFSDRP